MTGRETRAAVRSALDEAARAMCPHCAAGLPYSLRDAVPFYAHLAADGSTPACMARPVRLLAEPETSRAWRLAVSMAPGETYGECIRRLAAALDPADAAGYAATMAHIVSVAAAAITSVADDWAEGRG